MVIVLRQFFSSHDLIGFQTCNPFFRCGNHLRIIHQNIILQTITLGIVVCFQKPELCHLDVQIHLLLNIRIARSKCLDLRIGQCRFINIIRRPHRTFAGHDLGDKLLLILQKLPTVRIECAFGDIAENLHLIEHISLTDNASLLLFNIRRLPRHIQMVQRNQPVLHIHTGTHFCG